MKERTDSYDWAAYYRAAFEKEKKKNTVLAGKIADAEAKEADLSFRLQRIQNNLFWKLSAPARKCYRRLTMGKAVSGKRNRTGSDQAGNGAEAEQCIRRYRQEVYRQKHPYLQWIAQYERNGSGNGNGDSNSNSNGSSNGRLIDGWLKIALDGTDLRIILWGHGILSGEAEKKIKAWFRENPDCLLAYTDEDYYWQDLSNRMHPWFKPCWSPDTMLAFCYMGHMIITRQSLLEEVEGQTGVAGQKGTQTGSYIDFYDLCLRLEERASVTQHGISHMDEVLFHNCYEPDAAGQRSIAEAEKAGGDVLEVVEKLLLQELEQGRDMSGCDASFSAVREAALQRRGIRAKLETGPHPDIYHVVYEAPPGMVSVIIPSKDHPEVLERCLSSFRERTDYENYEWIVVDNGSDPENKKRMEALQQTYGFLYLYEPMEFNFSAMCNLGASRARGDYLLLLNDDIEIIQKDWLRIMAGQAAQPHVGAVGAKLWYAGSDAIQHAGITNLVIGPSHKLITFPDDRNYYYGHNLVTYDMIGVTAACLMIERQKFQEAGGMEESMKVAYNDVDFCFRLIEAGYYNVLRNDAVLYHAESLSRGLDEQDEGKWDRLLREKENLYARHREMNGEDIFYHKNLIDNASHYACNYKFAYEDHLKTTELFSEKAGNLTGAQKGVLQLTVDRAGQQHKLHREEPDILFLMGWSYIPGADNAKYERKLVLQQENDIYYYAVPCPWSRWDVEAILPGETNISLAGFVLRIEKEKLHSGVWRIGMLATAPDTRQRFLTWSDKVMTV